MPEVRLDQVRAFWEKNPVCAKEITAPLGSREYFARFDELREAIEPPAFFGDLHELAQFAGKRVLDVGCGNGFVLSRYARAGARVTGVDITEAGIELCKKRFALHGLAGEFHVAPAERLPFSAESFDCVCSMGVLHHVSDVSAAVGEIRRVLVPGGRLIIMLYHRGSARYRFKLPAVSRMIGKSLEQLVNEVDGIGNPRGEVYSRDEMRALLRDFRELEMWAGLLLPEDVLPWRLVSGSGAVPRAVRSIASALLKPLAPRYGWFLYGRAWK